MSIFINYSARVVMEKGKVVQKSDDNVNLIQHTHTKSKVSTFFLYKKKL